MLPRDLKAEQFAAYPPQARALAVAHLDALRQLPLSFLPSLLREVIDYDYKFPAERAAIDRELDNLSSLSPAQMKEWFHAFAQFSLSPKLESFDWINQPAQFVEQLSAYLWTTHQLDGFRKAATVYGDRLQAATPPEAIPVRRLGIAVIGQGVDRLRCAALSQPAPARRLFCARQARQRTATVTERGRRPGQSASCPLRSLVRRWWSAGRSQPIAYLRVVSGAGTGARRFAAQHPGRNSASRYGTGGTAHSPGSAGCPPTWAWTSRETRCSNRFQLKLLTEGSGTQIFSTTFAQWTAREALRRAQPLTLLVRFAPRQRQRPMNELLSSSHGNA